ncbi:RNA polymerase sigma-70 factor [Streptomyces sp. SID13031]|uniref:RNA polymerase sigma-70 factor n=1 Tax=Streptomyces sp. SID13031 TaxID=2706046 RepID=UPI0013CB2C7F|nr:RNA polymerase sigma-70 factor [Streptomyces sp. SID13031]
MTTDLDRTAADFALARPRLFGIAYRMLSSVQEAEDLVQDVWLKWQTYDRDTVREPAAFLATMITRLAINASQTARARRETYIGPWLPEPVDTSADPTLGAERGEALELAMLVLLEKLSPAQRAAYILREAFDYPYDQIAEIVQLSEANVRQLVSRSRKRLAGERREQVSTDEQRKLLATFMAAAQEGDLAALVELLAADAVSYSDGGGIVRATKLILLGADKIAKVIAAYKDSFWTGSELTFAETNGGWSAVVSRAGEVFAVISISASADGIDQVQWMLNPEKLANLSFSS